VVRDAFNGVVATCQAVPEAGPALDYMGSRAKYLNALVVEMVRREFADDKSIEVTEENRFLELRLRRDGHSIRVDLRFKLIDENDQIKNRDTDAQWLYRNQQLLLGEADVTSVARVTVGWRWNIAATALDDIKIVYAKGDEVLWSYSIVDEGKDGDGATKIVPSPVDRPSAGGARFVASYDKDHKKKA